MIELRQNSREQMSDISKKLNIPISTLFERLRKLEHSYVKRYVTLINNSMMGYSVKATFLIKVNKDKYNAFLDNLWKLHNINSVYKINNGFNLMIEGYFKNVKQINEFHETLQKINAEEIREHHIVEDIVIESMFADEKYLSD